ncbi:hypothetical protein B0O80DRAFT_424685 [Mortierella sp. GBAus27b]|nr:hypothetical protein B0O80DRAFT_426688 [Mortierella sp. GBAus27b]KAI8357699.1 hypothetical protein B0O80DRAFT_424685 [Mortierella sp. GBAus27b]
MAPQFIPLSSIVEASGSSLEALANNPRASVEPLAAVFSKFVDTLSKTRPYEDPIPKYLLPKDAAMFKRESLSTTDGLEYVVPIDADYRTWVEMYGRATGATFLLISNKAPEGCDERAEYVCDRSGTYQSKAGKNPGVKARLNQKPSKKVGCKARITISCYAQDKTMFIKIKGHTAHAIGTAEDIGNMRLSREIRGFIADRVMEGLDTKGPPVVGNKTFRGA